MSAPLLLRLHPSRDEAHRNSGDRRWCAGDAASLACDGRSLGVSSSGRLAGPGRLVAERADDGVLVASTADLAGERIVWVGDVTVTPDGAPSAGDAVGPARIRVGTESARVELVWPVEASVMLVEVTLPCRPVGQRTEENEGLDGQVHLEATEAGAVARIRPYPGLPSVALRFNGAVALAGPGTWRKGIPTLDRRGDATAEDRYSPGTFVVRLPQGATSLRLTAEVEAGLSPAAEAAPRTDPRGLLAELLAAPGLALESGWTPDQVGGWIGRHAAAVAADLAAARAEGRRAAPDDRALWLGRACQLLLRNLRGTWGPLTYRGLVEDAFLPTIRGIAADLCAVEGEASRDADSPGVGALRGSRRWYEVLTGEDGPGRDAVAVEAGALLHQLFVFEEQLCRMVADEAGAQRAAARALESRRWFQRAYWLPTPRRLADLEVERADPHSGAALGLRPGMLIAASLEGAPLDPAQRRAIVAAADERLLTPHGVRAMDRADLDFRPGALADGAIWPWLLGVHAEASIRSFGRDRGRLRFQEAMLEAADGAPEAWREGVDGGLVPAGDLWFAPAAGESVRAFHLLSEVLGEDEAG